MIKYLFGDELRPQAPDITEQYINYRDEVFFAEKAKRLKYLHKINPFGLTMAGQIELVLTYREVQFCFIDGHFLATIVLTQAFVEKLLHGHYNKLGFDKIATKGLNAILQHATKNKTINKFLIDRINAIRFMRNPITHSKDFNYEHDLDKRSYKNKTSPFIQLEKDAQEALEIATFIAFKGFDEII